MLNHPNQNALCSIRMTTEKNSASFSPDIYFLVNTHTKSEIVCFQNDQVQKACQNAINSELPFAKQTIHVINPSVWSIVSGTMADRTITLVRYTTLSTHSISIQLFFVECHNCLGAHLLHLGYTVQCVFSDHCYGYSYYTFHGITLWK